MIIIPAIDLKSGKCVRLRQGKEDEVTIFSEDPVATAKKWAAKGAELLHVVDLDGAFQGKPQNLEIVKEIKRNIDIPVELGGGIRNLSTIDEIISSGIDRVILGTSAISNPSLIEEACQKYRGKVFVGIDAKDGWVAIKGWVEVTNQKATQIAKRFEDYGVAGIIFTDIKRDGMLVGPNLESIKEIAQIVDVPVIASGGVSTLKDIEDLLAIEQHGIQGVIVGKALYTGDVDLEEAVELTKKG